MCPIKTPKILTIRVLMDITTGSCWPQLGWVGDREKIATLLALFSICFCSALKFIFLGTQIKFEMIMYLFLMKGC